MSDTASYRWNPALVFRDEGEGALIFNPESGDLKLINRTGALLLNLLMKEKEPAGWLDHLMETFPETPMETLQEDLNRFLEELEANDVLLPSDPA